MLALGLIIIGVLARFLPHLPNFTPVIAIALFGGVYFRKREAVLLPLALMVISDIFIGFHSTIAFTYGSILLVSLYGLWVRRHKTWRMTFAASVVSAVVFFVITNFGAWWAYYPHTWEGLTTCYTLAIPFFRTTLLSSVVYSIVLFGTYEFVAARVKDTRFAYILK